MYKYYLTCVGFVDIASILVCSRKEPYCYYVSITDILIVLVHFAIPSDRQRICTLFWACFSLGVLPNSVQISSVTLLIFFVLRFAIQTLYLLFRSLWQQEQKRSRLPIAFAHQTSFVLAA